MTLKPIGPFRGITGPAGKSNARKMCSLISSEAVPKIRFTLSERSQPEARGSRKTPVFVGFEQLDGEPQLVANTQIWQFRDSLSGGSAGPPSACTQFRASYFPRRCRLRRAIRSFITWYKSPFHRGVPKASCSVRYSRYNSAYTAAAFRSG